MRNYSRHTLIPGHRPGTFPPISANTWRAKNRLGKKHLYFLTYVVDLEQLYGKNRKGNFFTKSPIVFAIREAEWTLTRLGITHQVNVHIKHQEQLPMKARIVANYFNHREVGASAIHREALWRAQSKDDQLSAAADFDPPSSTMLTFHRGSDNWHYIDGKRFDTVILTFDVESRRVQPRSRRVLKAYINTKPGSLARTGASRPDTYTTIVERLNPGPDGRGMSYIGEGKGQAWLRLRMSNIRNNHSETAVFGANYRYPDGREKGLLMIPITLRSQSLIPSTVIQPIRPPVD